MVIILSATALQFNRSHI